MADVIARRHSRSPWQQKPDLALEIARRMSDNRAMGESPEIELVRRAWDALIAGGLEPLRAVLAPDAQ
jgi:hypothetical protein